MRKLLAAVIIAGVTACFPTELIVESNTEWAGSYGKQFHIGPGTVISGAGNKTFWPDLDSGETLCWSVQKETATGRLKVFVKMYYLIWSARKGESETSAPFGVVAGCVSGVTSWPLVRQRPPAGNPQEHAPWRWWAPGGLP